MTRHGATYDLRGATALVTGGAGDFGRTVAIRLAASGAHVVVTDLDQAADGLERTRSLCAAVATQGRVHALAADVTDPAGVSTLFDATARWVGVPTMVFNNAGVQGELRPVVDYPVADVELVLRVNVAGVFTVLREAAGRMRAAGVGGSIVNSASMAGVEGAANMPAYSASKGAVMSLTRSCSKDLAPLDIRVNAISPAFIGPGRMWHRQVERQAQAGSPYYASDPEEVARQMIGAVPMRRLGSVEEVAAAVLWLLSDESSYVTGQNLILSGGI